MIIVIALFVTLACGSGTAELYSKLCTYTLAFKVYIFYLTIYPRVPLYSHTSNNLDKDHPHLRGSSIALLSLVKQIFDEYNEE
jgi:hypothetical protein